MNEVSVMFQILGGAVENCMRVVQSSFISDIDEHESSRHCSVWSMPVEPGWGDEDWSVASMRWIRRTTCNLDPPVFT